MEISFQQWKDLDMRVGRIAAVEDIEGSKNLYKLIIDFGTERHQAVTSLKQHYSKEELQDKKFVFILNLERKRFMGVESQCMILAAEDGKNVVLIAPEKDIGEGSKIT